MKEVFKKLNEHNLPTEEQRNNKTILCLNENPYGCSEKVKDAIINGIKYNEYPDDNCSNLIQKVSKLYGVFPHNIMIGNGSGEILQILSRSILKDGDEVITCTPTYPYYYVETVLENADFIEVPVKNDRFDIEGILEAITDNTKMIYITNPNNPIGTIITEDEANKLIKNVRDDILIVFDEAYYEYVESEKFPNIVDKLKEKNNICILRTFSKAYGLAAMRVGYLIGSKDLIQNLNKARLTFNVSKPSQIAAEAAIEDQDFIISIKTKNINEKKSMYEFLEKIKVPYIYSETNFIVIKDNNNVISNALKDNNIIIKTFLYKNENHIRLSIGNEKTMEKIKKIIKETVL